MSDLVIWSIANFSFPEASSCCNLQQNAFSLNVQYVMQPNYMTEAHAFGGRATEDANKHLTKFIQISNTVSDE